MAAISTQSTTSYKPGFLSASSLMREALSDTSPTVASTDRSNHASSKSRTTKVQRARTTKAAASRTKVPKSAEYIVDSDESDAVAEPAPKALTRRQDWTPMKENAPSAGVLDSEKRKNFTNLVNGFQFDQPDAAQATAALEPVRIIASKGPRRSSTKKTTTAKATAKTAKAVNEPKVKKVVVKPPREPKVKKAKSKVQTITALAIAPYRPPVETKDPQPTIPEALALIQEAPAIDIPQADQPSVTKSRKRKGTATDSAKAKKQKKTVIKKNRSPIKDLPLRDLLAPVQARSSLGNQVFIFGTSSQLHAEESPETLTQIQQAIQETELSPQSAIVSPVRRSRVRVPTAPHGTSLSAGQAYRDLWCVSARDHEGGILTGEEDSQPSRVDSVHEANHGQATAAEHIHTLSEEDQDHGYELPEADIEQTVQHGEAMPAAGRTEAQQFQQVQDDEFLTLSSDSLPELPAPAAFVRAPSPIVQPPPWPSTQRAALQPLDANMSLKSPLGSRLSQIRAASSKARSPDNSSARKRGRPPKAIPDKQEVVVISSSSPLLVAERPIPPPKMTSPSKILATIQSSPPSEWHNIDEVPDSETPPTPSPPRKIASSPQAEATLEFDADEPVEPVPLAPTIAKDDPQWPTVFARLFPQITATIKALPRSDSLTNPNWHEKMLLYDPIVIEDLTTWLNSQGLRVMIRRTKSRKKKAVLEPEPEQSEEELAHWMVQKWCEEHSVCCLWKEGLRGGVRTRY